MRIEPPPHTHAALSSQRKLQVMTPLLFHKTVRTEGDQFTGSVRPLEEPASLCEALNRRVSLANYAPGTTGPSGYPAVAGVMTASHVGGIAARRSLKGLTSRRTSPQRFGSFRSRRRDCLVS